MAWVYGRIAPLPAGCSPLAGGVGRDVLWITENEVVKLVHGEFPDTLRKRLVFAHLRDFVRGEPGLWKPEDMKKADFRARATRRGTHVVVKLSGSFRTSAPVRDGYDEYWTVASGYTGTIEGELRFDLGRRRVTRFLLYAEGKAWGEVDFTPGAPPGRFPLKIGFQLARDDPAGMPMPYGAGSDVESYLREGYPSR